MRKWSIKVSRAVGSLSPPGERDKNISSICPHFPLFPLIFPQIFFIFLLILVFRVEVPIQLLDRHVLFPVNIKSSSEKSDGVYNIHLYDDAIL